MKVGRNDPCPCGSGKKYKKCCLGKDENLKFEHMPTQIPDETEYDERLGLKIAAEIYDSVRRTMLKSKHHIKEYNKIRKMHYEIINSMADYFHEGKFEQKIDRNYVFDIPDTPKNRKKESSLVLFDVSFDMSSEFGEHALYDMIMYKPSPNMNCITEEYINSNRYKKPEKVELLQSMLNSRLGLFELTGRDPEEGYAYIKDVLNGNEYKVTDLGLSGQTNPTDIFIYMRIITYRGVNFGTGFHLVFKKDDPFIKVFIQRHKSDYNTWGEFSRFMELYGYFSKTFLKED
jgi:hypothetical protein